MKRIGRSGRVLELVFTFRDDAARPVTAYFASKRLHSEAEEAAWWDQNREETAEWMEEAILSGKTTTLSAVLDRHQNRGNEPSISLKINSEDLKLAHDQAAQRGLSYQAYLKC